MKHEFLKYLQDNFRIDFNGDDSYVLDENDNVTELYLNGIWKTGVQCSHPEYFSDITVLLPLSAHLKVLYITSWKVEDMSPLKHFTHLTDLSLASNRISEICGIENLTALEFLDLGGNGITKIQGLEKLTELIILDLRFNGYKGGIKKIKGLDSLTKLQALYLDSNKIKSIENINHLTNLKRLTLHDNKIKKLENMDALSNLTRLTIGRNFTQFPDLSNHSRLEELGVQGSFDKIENLDYLESLLCINIETELKRGSINKLLNHKNLEDITVNFKALKGDNSQTFWTRDL